MKVATTKAAKLPVLQRVPEARLPNPAEKLRSAAKGNYFTCFKQFLEVLSSRLENVSQYVPAISGLLHSDLEQIVKESVLFDGQEYFLSDHLDIMPQSTAA